MDFGVDFGLKGWRPKRTSTFTDKVQRLLQGLLLELGLLQGRRGERRRFGEFDSRHVLDCLEGGGVVVLEFVSLIIYDVPHRVEGEAGVGVHVEHVILEVVEAVCRREANLRGRRGWPEQGSRLLCRSRVWGLQVVAHLCKDLVVLSVDLCDFPVGPRSDPLQHCSKQGERAGEVHRPTLPTISMGLLVGSG